MSKIVLAVQLPTLLAHTAQSAALPVLVLTGRGLGASAGLAALAIGILSLGQVFGAVVSLHVAKILRLLPVMAEHVDGVRGPVVYAACGDDVRCPVLTHGVVGRTRQDSAGRRRRSPRRHHLT